MTLFPGDEIVAVIISYLYLGNNASYASGKRLISLLLRVCRCNGIGRESMETFYRLCIREILGKEAILMESNTPKKRRRSSCMVFLEDALFHLLTLEINPIVFRFEGMHVHPALIAKRNLCQKAELVQRGETTWIRGEQESLLVFAIESNQRDVAIFILQFSPIDFTFTVARDTYPFYGGLSGLIPWQAIQRNQGDVLHTLFSRPDVHYSKENLHTMKRQAEILHHLDIVIRIEAQLQKPSRPPRSCFPPKSH